MHVGIANPRWRWKRSRHSRRMRNPQFYVSGKRPMAIDELARRKDPGHRQAWFSLLIITSYYLPLFPMSGIVRFQHQKVWINFKHVFNIFSLQLEGSRWIIYSPFCKFAILRPGPGSRAKWLSFCSRYFGINFLLRKMLCRDLCVTEIYSKGHNYQYGSIGLDTCLTPTRWRAIIHSKCGLD